MRPPPNPYPDLAATPPPGPKARGAVAVDALRVGDRVRSDRIHPFDRKPGLVARGYTYDNHDRYLPIERYGREEVLHLTATEETARVKFLDILRILLFIAAVTLGAMLFLLKPGITTAAFFCFCLAGVEAPATFFDAVVPLPWRVLPDAAGDVLRGFARPALLLFALCLIDGDRDVARERLFAWVIGAIALVLAVTTAYAGWRLNYAALPAEQIYRALREIASVLSVLTAIAFGIAFLRARRKDRERIGWIVVAFLFAGAMRLTSDALYPGHIPVWLNSILVSMTIVPIVVVWIAVIRHRFFNVDFVVSRAVVYVAITAGVFGMISVFEELGTYLFYQNADFAYIVLFGDLAGDRDVHGQARPGVLAPRRPVHLPRPPRAAASAAVHRGLHPRRRERRRRLPGAAPGRRARAQALVRRHPRAADRRELRARAELRTGRRTSRSTWARTTSSRGRSRAPAAP